MTLRGKQARSDENPHGGFCPPRISQKCVCVFLVCKCTFVCLWEDFYCTVQTKVPIIPLIYITRMSPHIETHRHAHTFPLHQTKGHS